MNDGDRGSGRAEKAAALDTPNPPEYKLETVHGADAGRVPQGTGEVGDRGQVDFDRVMRDLSVCKESSVVEKGEFGEGEVRQTIEGTEACVGGPAGAIGGASVRSKEML